MAFLNSVKYGYWVEILHYQLHISVPYRISNSDSQAGKCEAVNKVPLGGVRALGMCCEPHPLLLCADVTVVVYIYIHL